MPYHTTNIARWPPLLNPRNLFLHHFYADQVFSFSEGCKGRSFRPKHGKLAFPDQIPCSQMDCTNSVTGPSLLSISSSCFSKFKAGVCTSKPVRSLLLSLEEEEGQEGYSRADTECLIYFSSPTARPLHSFCPPQRGALSRVQARTQETSVDPFS